MATIVQNSVQKDSPLLLRNIIFVIGLMLALLCLTLPFLRYLFFTVPFLVLIAVLADGKIRIGEEVRPFLAFILAGLILSPLGNTEGIKDLFFTFSGISISLLYVIPRVKLWTIFNIFFVGSFIFFGLSGALTGGFSFDIATSESSLESPFAFVFGLLAPFALFEKRYRLFILCILMALLCLKRIALLGALVSCFFVFFGEKNGRYFLNAWVMVPLNVIFLVMLLMYGMGGFDYFIYEYTQQSADQLGMGRQQLLSLPAKEIYAHPEQFIFWGQGPGASYELSKYVIGNAEKVNLHSDLVKLFYEYGLLFYILMISLMYTARNYVTRVGFLFLNILFLTDNTLIYYFLLFIFICCVRSVGSNVKESRLTGSRS
ncbi:hypothetical protein [Methylobacillus sp. Pita1]|uniref:hypothetical protein n=1 Tax=Methylobacillus sp. Pita1 TaxID=3382642 RepID=UPI0038B62240